MKKHTFAAMRHAISWRIWLAVGAILRGLLAQDEALILRRAAKELHYRGKERTSEKASQVLYLRARVIDEKSGEPFVGAYVRVLGSVMGAVTETNGEFRIPTLLTQPVLVEISYVGYQIQRLTLTPGPPQGEPIEIRLQEAEVVGQEVIISASRIEEAFLRSPVQISQLSSRFIQDAPAPLFAQGLSLVPGLTVTHTSLLFPVINIRGLNHTHNVRFISRVDGMEVQSAAFNIPILPFTNPPEVDIASMEVVAGPASALYGPNAFNGLLSTFTRDPFQYPGFSFWLQGGVNHIGSPDRPEPTPFYQAQLRFARSWNNRFGFKVALQYVKGTDWYASSRRDVASYVGVTGIYAIPGPHNPGYIPENGYGYTERIFLPDWGHTFVDGTPLPVMYVSRTGYMENELITPESRLLKSTLGLSYRLSDQLELSLLTILSNGSTIFQEDSRYDFKSFTYQAHKVELKHSRGFVRVYGMKDNSQITTLELLGSRLLNVVKPHRVWFKHFLLAYEGHLQNGLSPDDKSAFESYYGFPTPSQGDAEAARRLADSDTRFLQSLASAAYVASIQSTRWDIGEARPLPHSDRLRTLRGSLLQVPATQGGALLMDRCGIYQAESQYELPSLAGVKSLIGANFRLFEINSGGTFFIDTAGKSLYNYEYGAFVQLRRDFWEERLKVTAALRFDQRQYVLRGQLTPRFFLSWAIDPKENHILRAGYHKGFRNPANEALFMYLRGEDTRIGSLAQIDRELGIAGNNNYTLASVRAYRAARARGVPPQEAAELLRSIPIDGIRPEIVQSLEVGSRHLLWQRRLLIDFTYAYSRYRDLHTEVQIYGPPNPSTSLSWENVENDILSPPYERYYNAPTTQTAHFITIASQYYLSRHVWLAASYTYSKWLSQDQGEVPPAMDMNMNVGFNTSPHQVNIALIGEKIATRWDFQLWYQWVDAFLYELDMYEGVVPAYTLLHAQVTYHVPRWNMRLRLGARNLLNFYHIEVRGAPSIGGLYYFQILYDKIGW